MYYDTLQARQLGEGALQTLLKRFTTIRTKSAAIFCHQVAPRVLNMFSKFYFIESTKLPITQQLLMLEKKISTDLKSLKF